MSISPPPLDDQMAIRDLFARYAWAYDCRDFEAVSQTFVTNGLMVVSGIDRCEGREEIARQFRKYLEQNHADKTMQHHIQHLVLDGNSEFCRAWSYWTVPVHISDGGCHVGALGWYEDELVKEQGQWLFRQRLIHDGMPTALPWEAQRTLQSV